MKEGIYGARYESEDYKDEVKELGELIAKSPDLLKLVYKTIVIFKKQEKVQAELYKYQSIMKKEGLIKSIDTYVVEKFIELWSSLNNEDIGRVLEEVIANLGPLYMSDNTATIRDCIIFNISAEEKIKLNQHEQKNFDVVFCKEIQELYKESFDKKVIVINKDAEFHECKKNITNCIPNETEAYKDMEEKLIFIKKVYEYLKENAMLSLNDRFFIPTFSYNTYAQQEYLDKNGYEFIKIIGIDFLINNFTT